MLWCRQTFLQTFSEDDCKLFPTQKQLFDFVDAQPSADTSSPWISFSIELLSEADVREMLSCHRAARLREDGAPPDACRLFKRVEGAREEGGPSEGALQEQSGVKRPRTHSASAPRPSFAVLYGETPLSSQRRMFLAATPKGLDAILTTIEPSQLHLYEIIREGTPCHLYFDVERESDVVSTQKETVVESSSGGDDEDVCVVGPRSEGTVDDVIVTASIHSRHGTRTYRSTRSEYCALLSRAVGRPRGACPLDCPVTPDNSQTTQTLMRELDAFVRAKYPFLAGSPSTPQAETCSLPTDTSPSGATSCGLSLTIPSWARTVIVLQSVPLQVRGPAGTAAAPKKFSQHYIIHLDHHVFDSNSSAGEFVRQFVEYLDAKCANGDVRVHASLFFHGHHILETALPSVSADQPSPAVPFVTRKCVIDTGVYSRNRMMRCLGSCKVNKTLTLKVAHWLTVSAALAGVDGCPRGERLSAAVLRRSLISAKSVGDVSTASLLHLDTASAFGMSSFGSLAAPQQILPQGLSKSWSSGGEEVAVAADATVVHKIETGFRRVSGCDGCTLSAARQLGRRFEVFQVHGSRYCQNVMREHKSNGVYIVLDKERQSWVQKCFDPDCANFRSTPFPL